MKIAKGTVPLTTGTTRKSGLPFEKLYGKIEGQCEVKLFNSLQGRGGQIWILEQS
jgi:hypothetical protein